MWFFLLGSEYCIVKELHSCNVLLGNFYPDTWFDRYIVQAISSANKAQGNYKGIGV